MIEPTEADVGRSVVYTGNYGGPLEDGVITSLNEDTVFVRYKSQHPGANGQATSRDDLNWLHPERRRHRERDRHDGCEPDCPESHGPRHLKGGA